MKILGLTGGIASGKNFVADIFAKNGAAVFDADAEVHKMFCDDKDLILKVLEAFPQIKKSTSQEIDRKALGKIVFSDPKKLDILEEIIHPIVRKKYKDFLKKSRQEGRKIIVLNIPLLLEKQGYDCDKVVAILIPPSLQKRRFFARKKNDSKQELENKFKKITQIQLKNKERKEMADFVINTRFSKAETARQVKDILRKL